ncbi:aspartate/glutamate racemase family protein [Nisaea denitrificans]|uniref:aspartate/glutamate racemase family protein n=1 Tax=Nisaea denitrificans TaxID=390877 RepID=UPI00041C9F3E|nr:amino acid racemase [Nisaea denitrificans]
MKHIGIVGCSAEGAALCYRTICSEGAALLGAHEHPDITMHTPPLSKYVSCLEAGDLSGVGELMLDSARRLERAGADFLICPDNTIHQAFDYVAERSPLPWLHIAEESAALAREHGFQKVGLLGTRWLVESDVYPDKFDALGIGWARPEPEEVAEISRIIMEELVPGRFRTDSISYFQALIERMKERGADSVLLGCTEIPLIISDENSALPTLDSTRTLARAALRAAAS